MKIITRILKPVLTRTLNNIQVKQPNKEFLDYSTTTNTNNFLKHTLVNKYISVQETIDHKIKSGMKNIYLYVSDNKTSNNTCVNKDTSLLRKFNINEDNKVQKDRFSRVLYLALAFYFVENVYAIDVPKQTSKPPKMKLSDLPVYDAPHFEYKRKLDEDMYPKKCRVKLLHRCVYPNVKCYRASITNWVQCTTEFICCEYKCYRDKVGIMVEDFFKYMRCEDNYNTRRSFVAAGTALGAYVGYTKYFWTKNIFFGTLGALISGWVCFPEQTSIAIREVSYFVAQSVNLLIYSFCGQCLFSEKGQSPCTQPSRLCDLVGSLFRFVTLQDPLGCHLDKIDERCETYENIDKIIESARIDRCKKLEQERELQRIAELKRKEELDRKMQELKKLQGDDEG